MGIDLDTTVVRTAGLQTAAVEQGPGHPQPGQQQLPGPGRDRPALWELLAEPRRLDDLCQQLGASTAASRQIAADVVSFVNELVGEGLLRVVDGQPS